MGLNQTLIDEVTLELLDIASMAVRGDISKHDLQDRLLQLVNAIERFETHSLTLNCPIAKNANRTELAIALELIAKNAEDPDRFRETIVGNFPNDESLHKMHNRA